MGGERGVNQWLLEMRAGALVESRYEGGLTQLSTDKLPGLKRRSNVDVFTGNDLLALSCTEFFPSPKSHPKTRRTHVLEAKMLHPLPAHERIMGRYNGGNPHV